MGMQLLDFLRKKETLSSPEAEAAKLDSYARKGIGEEYFLDFDPKNRPTVSLNFCLTRAAIIIQWLRILERHPSAPCRARPILDEFERLTFSPLPAEKRPYIIEHVRKLMKLASEINALMGNQSLSEVEAGKQGFAVSERWFGTAFDDQDFVLRTSLMYGAELVSRFHKEMERIGEMVGNAVFGKGKV
jgi:hypothetical protein